MTSVSSLNPNYSSRFSEQNTNVNFSGATKTDSAEQDDKMSDATRLMIGATALAGTIALGIYLAKSGKLKGLFKNANNASTPKTPVSSSGANIPKPDDLSEFVTKKYGNTEIVTDRATGRVISKKRGNVEIKFLRNSDAHYVDEGRTVKQYIIDGKDVEKWVEFDDAEGLLKRTKISGKTKTTYGKNKKLVSRNRGNISVNYAYDEQGRVVSKYFEQKKAGTLVTLKNIDYNPETGIKTKAEYNGVPLKQYQLPISGEGYQLNKRPFEKGIVVYDKNGKIEKIQSNLETYFYKEGKKTPYKSEGFGFNSGFSVKYDDVGNEIESSGLCLSSGGKVERKYNPNNTYIETYYNPDGSIGTIKNGIVKVRRKNA